MYLCECICLLRMRHAHVYFRQCCVGVAVIGAVVDPFVALVAVAVVALGAVAAKVVVQFLLHIRTQQRRIAECYSKLLYFVGHTRFQKPHCVPEFPCTPMCDGEHTHEF